MTSRWRLALRMAFRELRRHKVRTVLTMLLVALPVVVGTSVALMRHNSGWEGEQQARDVMGAADALVKVTPFDKVKVTYSYGELRAKPADYTRRGSAERVPVRRDPSRVTVGSLLPDGSTTTPAPAFGSLRLSSGGIAYVTFLDASSPLTTGLLSSGVSAGRAPTAPDEAAIPESMADELGLLDSSGDLLTGATLKLGDGDELNVVGLLEAERYTSQARVLAPPDSVLNRHPGSSLLVDLPAMSRQATHELVSSLAADGVAMLPRDVMFHPAAWHAEMPPTSPVDVASVATGALIVLFGLIEVVLIVGSAFAVGARRQVRDLGLLSASGGTPGDVRRVLLAQGLVLGVIAAVVGAAAGIGVFFAAIGPYEAFAQRTVWTRDIDWLSVVAVASLGAVSGLVAALFPAWSISRLTPVSALSGRFPVRPGESAAHRPAFVLAGAGLVVLAISGTWSAREFAPGPKGSESPLPVALGGLGLLLLVAGTVWAGPFMVRRVAALGQLLPLSGRFAFRDAARHRFRTAAAAVSLMITAAGAVLVGFTVSSASAASAAERGLPPDSLLIYRYGATQTAEGTTALLSTLQRVVGEVTALNTYQVRPPDGHWASLVLAPPRYGYQVSVIDDALLLQLIGTHDTQAVHTFRNGGIVTAGRRAIHHGTTRMTLEGPAKPSADPHSWRLPAVAAADPSSTSGQLMMRGWISKETATTLGLQMRPTLTLALTSRPVTNDDITRLAVYGIDARSDDPVDATWQSISWGAIGVAGLLTALVAGMAVALSAAEGRTDLATMTAVGAGPWRRRSFGAMHGFFLGLIGGILGLAVSVPAGLALTQVDGLSGTSVPWLTLLATLFAVPLMGGLAGWIVTPTKLSLVRRTA